VLQGQDRWKLGGELLVISSFRNAYSYQTSEKLNTSLNQGFGNTTLVLNITRCSKTAFPRCVHQGVVKKDDTSDG
jgi:hypothetical protein